MRPIPDEHEVLEKLQGWGGALRAVRAMILTSSRARADLPADALSDYDLVLALTDVTSFAADESWLGGYGDPMVRWGDEHELYGARTYFRSVVYQDGVKVDYTLWPDELLDRVRENGLPDVLDVGYRVLLDKDGRTRGWSPPTHRAYIPAIPSASEYRALVEEFWWETTYVARSIWRGELVFTKFLLDYDIKLVTVRRLLEWRIEIDHDWSLKPGIYGRGLERLLPSDIWSALAATYVSLRPDDNWAALRRLCALFRTVAAQIGDALGYAYPRDMDEAVTAYIEEVRELPRPVARASLPHHDGQK